MSNPSFRFLSFSFIQEQRQRRREILYSRQVKDQNGQKTEWMLSDVPQVLHGGEHKEIKIEKKTHLVVMEGTKRREMFYMQQNYPSLSVQRLF